MTTARRDRGGLLAVGASAGGVDALTAMVGQLPADLPYAVLVVLHVSDTSVLPQILDRAGPLRALHAEDGEPLHEGRIYVAPPGRHMIVDDGRIRLIDGPRQNGHRPAVDPLMRSAAAAGAGRRIVGAILSGTRDDGTAGLARIKAVGGTTIVQDPDEALYTGMPQNALDHVEVDHVVRAAGIGPLLARPGDRPGLVAVSGGDSTAETHTGITCPDCGGVLEQHREHDVISFRCRVGHAYSHASLLAEQAGSVEAHLWAAARSLEERAELLHRMAARAAERGHKAVEERAVRQAREMEAHSRAVKELVTSARLDASELPGQETAEG